ncbi:MAG: B12-binding domain-containing radical SAM protein [Promethearchaeota archaeon]
MKILFVNPGKIEAGLDYIIKGPPLALLTIAAMVPKHQLRMIDFKVEKYKPKKFFKILEEHDICAITCMTPQISQAIEIANIAKKANCITIVGGYQPTLDPENIISHKSIDFAVRGEGERTFKELIATLDKIKKNIQNINPNSKNYKIDSNQKINSKEIFDETKNPYFKEFEKIKGISYKNKEGKIIHNPARPLEPNLDNFPIPNRDLLRGKHYNYMGPRVNLLETSRGCPHSCKFCCIIKMWNDDNGNNQGKLRYREKSIKRVMQEIYSILNLKKQKWDFIFFNDDNFTIDVKRTDKLLDAIIESRVNRHIFFSCQSRVDTLYRNPWLIEKMAKAGFRQIFLGTESVHQKSLDAMNKHITPEQTRAVVKLCKENGISIFAGMIIGFIGEDKEMVKENIEFALELSPDFIQFTPITAFPGTEFFEELKANNMITTYNYKYYDLFHPMLRTNKLSNIELYELVGEAYAKFYINISYIKKMLYKLLFNPKFRWFYKFTLKWIKQFIFGGWGMFRSQGISTRFLKEPYSKKYYRLANLKKQKKYSKHVFTRPHIEINYKRSPINNYNRIKIKERIQNKK